MAYLDLTGSGVETIAHLRADGRITRAKHNPTSIDGLPGVGRAPAQHRSTSS